MAPTLTRAGFRRWRRTRPFWGGLLLLLAGLELFWSANQTLGDLEVHFGPEGFLSYLLPLLLVLTGVLTWVSPAQRLFYGVLGLLTAVYSLIGLNFGGFVLGMLLGILGGALVLAWAPRKTPAAPPPAAETRPEPEPGPGDAPIAPAGLPFGAPPELVPGLGHDSGPDETQEITPAQPPTHRKALVLIFVPLAVTAAVLLAGGRVPARADGTCPDGLPSRSTSATAATARKATPPAAVRTSTATAPRSAPTGTAPKSKKPAARQSTSAAPEQSDDAEEGDAGPGSSLLDGLHDLVDGVLGTPSATASPSGPAPASPSPSPTADPSHPATPSPSVPPSATASPGASSAAPSRSPSGSASPSPTPSSDDIPCLGPRVHQDAAPDGVPTVAAQPALLETDKLTLTDSTYDGVAEIPTADGPMRTLKFSMDKAENVPFSLTLPAQHGLTTVITSDKLVTAGTVMFYTPRMQGKLFGVIPVTFTPDQPPPLTLPTLVFTDVSIDLAFIRCDTLTADPLKIAKKG
ncbi:DUF6114 domain-containing protein [Actinoplanes sp. N902-109]|uniref:DUF6114 domain-containing protein n=1 Tax=Actinoplanes sp. (strain N902-109) TaxID=649831 RepID=UPI000329517B|nr:DUF6114 domain-containing protein [Actinoplanes sp. N902-109]AGL18193.1 hypothetical protein L083_4683 [Actinoplanes sp. N902-109]